MKKYIILCAFALIIGTLIYFSSVYLLRAELSFRRLAQNTEELENINLPANKPEPNKIPKPVREIPVYPAEPAVPDFVSPQESIPEQIPETTAPETTEKAPEGPPLISMDFEKADLKNVLKVFCQQSGLNFIASENVELKPITLYLNNVPVQDALDSIIRANRLTYERVNGSNVFIVRESGVPKIELDTKIYKLKYAIADDKTVMGIDDKTISLKGIKDVIKKLLTPNGDLSIDERTNSLIVTDIPSRFPLIESSIADLDMQLPQVLIEAKIVEITSSDLEQLGIKWTSLAGYTIRLQDPTRQYLQERWGGHDRTDINENTVIDSWTRDWTERVIYYTDADQNTRTVTDEGTKHLKNSDIRSAILSADDFQLTLSLLLTDGNLDVISCPNVVTEHGKEAKITVGEQYPIPQFAYNDQTSTFEVQGFEYKDIGIILRVVPYATKQDMNISVDVHPEISSIFGSSNFRGVEIPIISTRTAKTNVSIKDGDTLAIGGLLRDRDSTTETKIPVLGDIPVLGRLFKHKEALKTKTNLIIFITPHIIMSNEPQIKTNQEVIVSKAIAEPVVKTTAITAGTAVSEDNKETTTGYQFGHR